LVYAGVVLDRWEGSGRARVGWSWRAALRLGVRLFDAGGWSSGQSLIIRPSLEQYLEARLAEAQPIRARVDAERTPQRAALAAMQWNQE
jgi:hypothetical protein